jgi:Macrocin-O-methyltransferase (TylF)
MLNHYTNVLDELGLAGCPSSDFGKTSKTGELTWSDEMSSPSELYIDLMKKCLTASIYEESGWQILRRRAGSDDRTLRRPIQFLTNVLLDLIRRVLGAFSLRLAYVRPFDMKKRQEGRDWPFIGYTMAGHRRLENVQDCIEDVVRNRVAGDLIETGAWRGGTCIFMRAILKVLAVNDRIVWVADSFEGLPVPTSRADGTDLSKEDFLKVSVETVQANFEKFGLLDDQVRFLKGWFCDTLPSAPIERLAILRLDGDLYSSTLDALNSLYHRVSPGGYVIVDDYFAWPGCKQAVTDFLDKNHIDAEIKAVDWTGAYWKVKPTAAG